MPMPVLMQSVSVVGMIGMNALAVFVFATPALLAARRDRVAGLGLAVLLCVAHAGYGYWVLSRPIEPDGRTLTVRIVQPSVDMSEKWDAAAQERVFTQMMEASAAPPAEGLTAPQLILWPETSVPFLFSERPDALAAIGAMLADGQMLLAGAVRSEGGGAAQTGATYYNAVVAIDHDGEIADAVDKVHLVPFGEYLPLAAILERLGLDRMVAGPMNFAAGAARHAITLPGGIMAVPFICYEIIFPDLVAVDAAKADIIVNVTNDGWFGNTPGPYQHFRQAQVRAVETGLPLLRAANTGISAIVDQRGRIVDALALDARGVIDGKVVLASPKPFPPLRLIGFAIVVFFGVFAVLMRLRQRLQAN
jgi:apolipoprotein N-acyltransferase